jgi:Guanine nucleotide exchange factor synembryn
MNRFPFVLESLLSSSMLDPEKLKNCNDVFESGIGQCLSEQRDVEYVENLSRIATALYESLTEQEDVKVFGTLESLPQAVVSLRFLEQRIQHLRSMKNLWRWALQITHLSYTEHRKIIESVVLLTNENESRPLEPYLRQISSSFLLTASSDQERISDTHVHDGPPTTHGDQDLCSLYQEVGRYATLCLLYACQIHHEHRTGPNLEGMHFLPLVAQVLSNGSKTSVSWQLASLRVLNHLIVAEPGFDQSVRKFHCSKDFQHSESHLSPTSDEPPSTMLDVLWELTGQSLSWEDDRRHELRIELLRILYALRAGRYSSNPINLSLLTALLRRPNCRLETVHILMDIPSSSILNMNVTEILVDTMETQVSNVVNSTSLGVAAAKAVTPILMVLRQLCLDSPEVFRLVKARVFPNPLPESYTGANKAAMSPADAPKGSLRHKCIRLLSWTEAHTKRWMAELLWTLCNNDANEYAHRVGLGNAIPLLQARGLLQVPPQSI